MFRAFQHYDQYAPNTVARNLLQNILQTNSRTRDVEVDKSQFPQYFEHFVFRHIDSCKVRHLSSISATILRKSLSKSSFAWIRERQRCKERKMMDMMDKKPDIKLNPSSFRIQGSALYRRRVKKANVGYYSILYRKMEILDDIWNRIKH